MMRIPSKIQELFIAKTSLEEKELWPEFFWSFASLLKAGYLPVQAISALLPTYQHRPVPTGAKHAMEHRARALAEQDIVAFLCLALDRGCHGYSLSGVPRQITPNREHSRLRLRELDSCLSISERTGAPLADVIENLAKYCENDIDAELARESAMSAPVTTGKILSLLPLLGLVLGMLMGTDPLGVLFGSIPGGFLAVFGAALAFGGHRWTRRLVNEAESQESEML